MPPKRGRRPKPRSNPVAPTRDISQCTLSQLQQAPVVELRAHLRGLSLSTSGNKRMLADRIFHHFHPPSSHGSGRSSPVTNTSGRQNSPRIQLTPSPATSHPQQDSLEATVTRLVEQGIRSALQGHIPPNLSLPSNSPQQNSPRGSPMRPTLPVVSGRLDVTRVPSSIELPPVPNTIRNKVEKGEYVDFAMLLQENMYPTPSDDPSYTLSVCPDPDSSSQGVLISQSKHKRRSISDLSSWLQAWNTYVLLMVHKEPHRALDLLSYQRFICEVSTRSPCSAWLLYDRKFRMAAAANPSLPWGRKNTELWLECFTNPLHVRGGEDKGDSTTTASSSGLSRDQARRPCTYCSSLKHFPDNCPRNPFRSQRAPSKPESRPFRSSSPTPRPRGNTGTCNDYNGPFSCRRKVCNFRHQCSICNGGHTRRDCPRATRT